MAPSAASSTQARAFAWRLAFLYGALFLVVGCYLPYMPVWLNWRGLDADAIAVLLATPLFARVLATPLISFAADRAGDRRGILNLLAWGSLLSFLLLWVADGFWQMFGATILLAVAWTTIMPLIETVAVRGVRNAGLDYGKVRLWGSGTFILASFGAGLVIQRLGAGTVLPMLVLATLSMVLAAYLLPRALTGRNDAKGKALPRLRFADAAKLARSRLFLLFLLAASTVQASHAVLYTFGSLHWRAQGIPEGAIGALWGFGVAVEIALFFVGARVLAVFGAARLLLIAAIAAVLRWGMMALDPPFWGAMLLQSLHGLSFGAAHLAAIYFLTHAVPEDRAATAQGLYAAIVAGLALGLATVASGPLYRLLGGQAYAAMALLALVSVLAAGLLVTRWQGDLVVLPLEPHPHRPEEGGEIFPDL
jgi:PPP family 3-phenylpropionic acid transporter